MKLEDQVCSLELAKLLKELGVKQDSVWYWMDTKEQGLWLVQKKDQDISYQRQGVSFSAFTVAELGEMLSSYLTKGKSTYFLVAEKNTKNWWMRYPGLKDAAVSDVTEANARASMLVYLLENKII